MLTPGPGNWADLTFPKTSGTVTRDWEKIVQQIGAVPVTIPETIAGRISVPVPFSF